MWRIIFSCATIIGIETATKTKFRYTNRPTGVRFQRFDVNRHFQLWGEPSKLKLQLHGFLKEVTVHEGFKRRLITAQFNMFKS